MPFGYHVADPNSVLLVTGSGIEDVKIAKKAWVLPGAQKWTTIPLSPFDFEISLQAMTVEKLQFTLPAVFTIGPDNDREALKKYAILLSGNPDNGIPPPTGTTLSPKHGNHVQDIVKGIIEGETRVIVSGMTMEEIFKERQIFKTKIIENVQSELDQFGLKIYNANVKELQDTPGSEYFSYLSRKAHEGASNQAKVDVAAARAIGEKGEAVQRAYTRQEISRIEAETAVLETKRKSEKAQADAELTTTQTRLDMDIKLAKIKATREAESRDAELQRAVEIKRVDMELERRRATDVVSARIERESAAQKADGRFYTDTKAADAASYKQKQEAEAAFYRITKEAEAHFYAKKKEAEGMVEMAKAYGQLAGVLGGPQGVLQLLMLENNTYEKLAKANATAINGLQPKISVWNTGSEGAGDVSSPIRNLFQTLPPLLSTIQEQTGIMPPNWMAQMPSQIGYQGQDQNALVAKGKKSMVNGEGSNH